MLKYTQLQYATSPNLQNVYFSDSLLCQSPYHEYLSLEIYCKEILEPLTKCSFPL